MIIHVANIGGHFAIVRLVLPEKIAYIYKGKGWDIYCSGGLTWIRLLRCATLFHLRFSQGPILFQTGGYRGFKLWTHSMRKLDAHSGWAGNGATYLNVRTYLQIYQTQHDESQADCGY